MGGDMHSHTLTDELKNSSDNIRNSLPNRINHPIQHGLDDVPPHPARSSHKLICRPDNPIPNFGYPANDDIVDWPNDVSSYPACSRPKIACRPGNALPKCLYHIDNNIKGWCDDRSF
jgi:hypothetical protein